MENNILHFVLDSFMHYMPMDKVDDYIRRLVGRRVLLMPDDECEVDHNCIEGFYMGKPCCHVSARKAPVLRELMRTSAKDTLVVVVKGHNLEKGYHTVYCEVVVEESLTEAFWLEHQHKYEAWQYAGKANVMSRMHRNLVANTEYLLECLEADGEDVSDEEVSFVLEAYLDCVPWAMSREDKENCVKVNTLLQNSKRESLKKYNAQLVQVLGHLNCHEQRTAMVRAWIDELKKVNVCRREAEKLGEEELQLRVENLRDFPENLYDCYMEDFDTFSGNLYYNHIPRWKQQQFMCGVAVCELAMERMSVAPLHVPPLPECVNQQIREDGRLNHLLRAVICKWADMVGKAGVRTKWSHVKHVLEAENVICEMNETDFGRFVHELCPDLKAENVRKSVINNAIELKAADRGLAYRDWLPTNTNRMTCMKLADDLLPISSVLR